MISHQFQGCAAIVCECFPHAVYVHCPSHSLNLALCHFYNIPVIRNSVGTLKEVIDFFRTSPKHFLIFKLTIRESNPITGTKRIGLNKFCETGWVEHLKAILSFKEIFITISKTMRGIQEHPDSDSESSSKAYSLLSAIERSSFVAVTVTVSKAFSLSQNLSTALQSETIHLVCFLEDVDDLKSEVRDMRETSEATFHPLFTEVTELGQDAEIRIRVAK